MYTNICSIRTLILYSETEQYETLFDMCFSVLSISKKIVDNFKYNTDNTSNIPKTDSGKCTKNFKKNLYISRYKKTLKLHRENH